MNLAGRLARFTGKKLENEEARKIFDEYRVFRDFSFALHILMLTGGGKVHGEYKLGK